MRLWQRVVAGLSALTGAASTAHAGGEPPGYASFFARAFEPGFALTIDEALKDEAPRPVKVTVTIFEAGLLALPSGRVVAADPFVGMDRPAFTREVPKGSFPVSLAILEGSMSEGRIALARVAFSPAPVISWDMAVVPGQDVATLKPDEFFGYPVDAGTGCFTDAGTALAAHKHMTADEDWSQTWIDEGDRMARGEPPPRFHLNVPEGPGNIVMFDSGWGDGLYPSWFGLDAAGNVAVLITDFQVIDWEKASR